MCESRPGRSRPHTRPVWGRSRWKWTLWSALWNKRSVVRSNKNGNEIRKIDLNNPSLFQQNKHEFFLDVSKPAKTNKATDSFPTASGGVYISFFLFFTPVCRIQSHKCTENWDALSPYCYFYSCFTEQRDRGADKDLRRADRQDGEELAAASHPGQVSKTRRVAVEKLLRKWSRSVLFITPPRTNGDHSPEWFRRFYYLLTLSTQDPQEWLPRNHSVHCFDVSAYRTVTEVWFKDLENVPYH